MKISLVILMHFSKLYKILFVSKEIRKYTRIVQLMCILNFTLSPFQKMLKYLKRTSFSLYRKIKPSSLPNFYIRLFINSLINAYEYSYVHFLPLIRIPGLTITNIQPLVKEIRGNSTLNATDDEALLSNR